MPFPLGHSHGSSGPSVAREDIQTPGSDFADGQQVGTFMGRLIRPRASRKGMTVQILGENGQDADTIVALHLSSLLDTQVSVQVVFIKHGDGRYFKKDGEWLRFPLFEATIKRPTSHAEGLIAQLFAENGKHADTVNQLNLTEYLDSMVYVVIRKADGQSVATTIDPSELEEASRHLTPSEIKGQAAQQKLARGAWRMLTMSGFFRKDAVLRALGDTAQFAAWIPTQACCHPGQVACQNGDVEAFLIPDPGLRFRHVPFCHEHAAVWETGSVVLPNATSPHTFLLGEQARLVHQWAQARLRELLNTPAGHDPTPSAIQRFAIEKHLTNALPDGFAAFFQST